MYSEIILTLCWTLVLVRSFPALVYNYYSYNPNIGNLQGIGFRDDEYLNNDYTLKESEKSSPCLQNQNGDVNCLFNYGESTENVEFLRLLGQDKNSAYEQSLGNVENAEFMEVVPSTNPNYNVYQYDSSPNHYETYIHGLIPSHEEPVFISNPSESHLPFNRPARKTASYEEFLAQLSHDAMMNNILPTMSYLRTPEAQMPYISVPASVQAAYPHVHATGGCAQPVYVSCSPIVSRGYIANQGYQYTPYALRNRKLIRDKVKVVKPEFVSKQDIQNELPDSVPVNNS